MPAKQWTPLDGPVDGDAAAAPVAPGTTQLAGAADKAAEAGAAIAAQAVAEMAGAPCWAPTIQVAAASALPSKGDASQTAGKGTAKTASDAGNAKSFDLAGAADAKGSKGAEQAGAVGNGASGSHDAQSNGQPMQHSQADPAQTAAVTAKAADGGTLQAQTVPMHVAAHDTATAVRTPDSAESTAGESLQRGNPSNQLDGDEATAASGVNAAKLIQTMGETEMRVGMRSTEFGDISIRTSVTPQQMLAQISLEHGDLSQAISAHVGAMQTKLGEESGLPTVIEVSHSGNQFGGQPGNHLGASTSGDSGRSPQGEQRGFVRSARTESAAVAVEADVGLGAGPLMSTSNGYRLDIRA